MAISFMCGIAYPVWLRFARAKHGIVRSRMINIHGARFALIAASIGAFVGCDPAGGRVNPPRLDPQAMAAAAVAHCDITGDKLLDSSELARCPALKRNLAQIDTNQDGKLTVEEIAARLQSFHEAGVGLVGLSARFTLDGQPLDGARVVLTPEKWLAAALQPAEAVTTPEGVGFFQTSSDLPGVQPGLYRLEIYRSAEGGQESIPARYNKETTLGIDAGVDSPDVNNRTHFALTSK